MRLLPLLQTVLWAAFLGSPLRGGSSVRHVVYWNSSNPRLLRGDAMVELGLNDYLDIVCPHYEGPGPPEGPETFALYMVDWPGYESCQAEGPRAFKRWVCSLPFGHVQFSEKIQRFTPFSLGFEFLPGETYYYISVPTPESSGQCLRLQVSVCCKERNLPSYPKEPELSQDTLKEGDPCCLHWGYPFRPTRWSIDGERSEGLR
ncbi:PREDICTED: ephrin-A4 isoform X1 [Colobus angolensis palliatus]|uniref:ephrin-A4 isoform X1 n=1 Tax=Colobus angolensis palliatus TaxID=336983 RepID=UPI0005F3BBE5|nr:PREDICTED: ephrin-A4 isoform X1 [Colobus angolensis palliatus]